MSAPSNRRALLALAAAAFGIGTTEFVIMGLLPELATNLSVSIPQAGLLISGYALGVTVGGPLLTLAAQWLPRKATLAGLMLIFVAGNLGCALAPNYALLMSARIVTAICHAAFFGIGAVVSTGLVPREKRTQAISVMFGGLTLANVLGVPLGTLLGQWAGWRSTFWAVAVIGLIALAALLAWVPRETARSSGLASELRVLRLPQIWLTLLTSVVSSTSMFVLFTYISPVLRDVTGVPPHYVGGVLLLCGLGLTVGNLVGARLGDWKMLPSLLGAFFALVVILAVFALVSEWPLPAITMLVIWCGFVFAATTILQARVVDQAKQGANLASTLNIGAFNLGNALGAGLGGFAIGQGVPLRDLAWIASAVAVGALALGLTAARLERRTEHDISLPQGHAEC